MSGAQTVSGQSTLSYEKLQEILAVALWKTGVKYADKPYLVSCLKANIEFAHEECQTAERDPQEILNGFIRSERTTVHAWNSHRLGKATHVNKDDASMSYDVEDNIVEANAAFPLRYTAQTTGVEFEQPDPLPEESYYACLVAKIITSRFTKLRTLKKNKSPRAVPGSAAYDKLDNAPSPNVPFPSAPANITIAEIICFLPQWLKSIDVIDRAVSNGGTTSTITHMINTFRDMPRGNIGSNSVWKMMQASMIKRGEDYKNWTIGNHVTLGDHDETSISVAGFRTRAETLKSQRPGNPACLIPFKQLGTGVKQMPTGYDALDLTRCVSYHMTPEHQDEEWNFPDDFEALVNVLGGPTMVKDENYDKAVFNRWTSGRSRAAADHVFKRQRDANGRLLKPSSEVFEENAANEESSSDADADTPHVKASNKSSKRVRKTPITPKPSNKRRKQAIANDSGSDSEDAFKGSKRSDALGRKAFRNKTIRRSSRAPKKVTYANTLGYMADEDTESEPTELQPSSLE